MNEAGALGGAHARTSPGLVVRGGGLLSRRTHGGLALSQLATP